MIVSVIIVIASSDAILRITLYFTTTTIPIAWKVVRGNTKGAWLPLCEAMLALLRGALPKSMPVYVLTNRGLWSPELFRAIQRNRWHPLMRINAQGYFRPLWGRRKRAFASLCPARAGQQVVLAGEAFRYRLRGCGKIEGDAQNRV